MKNEIFKCRKKKQMKIPNYEKNWENVKILQKEINELKMINLFENCKK